jgi:hypothetical protein
MEPDATTRIAERRRVIAERTAELQAELAVLVAEAQELDVAERVLRRFSEPAPDQSATPIPNGADDTPHTEGPTLPQMVYTILEEAKAKGRKGVESAEMIRIIRERWKPEFTADNVRPTLWRMVQKQRLRKRGKIYSMPNNSPEGETGAVAAPA